MSNDAYINELSLFGQYESIEEFLDLNRELLYVVGWLEKRNYKLLKKYDFYMSKITKDHDIKSLSGYRPVFGGASNDILRRLKMDILKMCNVEPFWMPDDNEIICSLNGAEVTGSSVAKAALLDGVLLSFDKSVEYTDKELNVSIGKNSTKRLFSINRSRLLADDMLNKKLISNDEYIKLRYRNTRLNFTKLQSEYGSNQLQKAEFLDCIKSFDRFTSFNDWNELQNDISLKYKAYTPASKKDDWFAGTIYSDKSIDKFRCVNPKRCYGYRDGDTFFALRIERDHKISDNG